MESHSVGLTSELLELTHRYLTAADLRSFIIPLPFSDDSLLEHKGVLVKILSNVSSIPKDKLFEIISALSYAGSNEVLGQFARVYESTITNPRRQRSSRQPSRLMAKTRITARQHALQAGINSLAELQAIHTSAEITTQLQQLLYNLQNPHIVGFVLVIGLKQRTGRRTNDEGHYHSSSSAYSTSSSASSYIPIAGGIVELLDPEEHCLRGIWCHSSLVNDTDSEFAKILVLRLLGHAFDYGYPGQAAQPRLKHTSILNVHGILFPKQAFNFLLNCLKFGKHFETLDNGGSHEDSASHQCRCLRLANMTEAQLFWGISESRLKSTFSSIKSQVSASPSQGTLHILSLLSACA